MKIAFLGLGIMGGPMAANLAKKGHTVTGWNRSPGKVIAGVQMESTPYQAASGADAVWLCVADTKAVEQVLFGENGVEGALKPGMVVVDSSTISPSASKTFAERIRARGAEMLDAPITGSKIGAESGQLIFIVGGPIETIERVRPLFEAMGKTILHMGENGMGESAKLAGNLMISSIYEGLCEALTLAGKLGVGPEKVMSLVNASMIRSGVSDYKGPFILKRDFSPNFPTRLMHKDLHLILDAAKEAGVELPATQQIEKVYQEAKLEGYSELDYSATLMILEKKAKLSATLSATGD